MNVWNDNCTTGNKKGEAARERVKQNTKKQTITGNEGDVVGGVWRCQDAEKCADVKEKEQREGKKERRRSGPLGSLSATPRPPSLFSPFTSRQSPVTSHLSAPHTLSVCVCVCRRLLLSLIRFGRPRASAESAWSRLVKRVHSRSSIVAASTRT